MNKSTKEAKNEELVKNIIRRLHKGEDPEKIKREFGELIKELTPVEISRAEEQLIKEGMSAQDIQNMCDVHLAVLEESFKENSNELAPDGHPINILMKEHAILLKYANKLRVEYNRIKLKKNLEEDSEEFNGIKDIMKHFEAAETHYLREENVLFPILEKHGISQPPQIMWNEHQIIRETKKDLRQLLEKKDNISFKEFLRSFRILSQQFTELLSSHFYKENNILFPTALKVFNDDEWNDVREEFDEIGYCCFTPTPERQGLKKENRQHHENRITDNNIEFLSGSLSVEELDAIFRTLPFDITFVDKDDLVKFYSEGPKRIFVRTPSVIGREVIKCHPNKSIDKVLEIVKQFKDKTLDKAEFWININERLIYIRYFPVRNKLGEYLGVLEVTHDITKLRELKGEKRLL